VTILVNPPPEKEVAVDRPVISPWVNPLRLSTPMTIRASEQVLRTRSLPDWVGMLVWCGWWNRIKQINGVRIFTVILLPTRTCCSALVGLGSLLGSIEVFSNVLDWQNLVSLPLDTPIFLRHQERGTQGRKIPLKGELGEIKDIKGQKTRRITLHSAKKKFDAASLFVTARSIDAYEISLSPHFSPHIEGKMKELADFYSGVSPEFGKGWLMSGETECLLVTNMSAWRRDVEDVVISTGIDSSGRVHHYFLPDLLNGWGEDNYHQPRMRLSAPKTVLSADEKFPVAVLDGPDALRSWENIKASNTIILLERSEYDESAESVILTLTNARIDTLLPDIGKLPGNLPSGVEIAQFSLEGGG
jgi:hypothetical protein